MGDAGLILGLGVDPAGAEQGFSEFDQMLDDATQKWHDDFQRAAADTDEGLLSNRESVRLLGEEFGLHMPRAVSSALSKMLPDIAQLGGALLGIYAAKELYEGVGKFTDWIRGSFTEQTKDAQDFAEAAAAAYQAAGKAAEDAFTKFNTTAAGAFDIALIDAQAKRLGDISRAYHELVEKAGGDVRQLGAIDAQAIQTIADAAEQDITSLEQADQKVAEVGALQFAAHKRMTEVQTKEDKAAAAERKRQASEEYRALEERYQANQRAYRASEEALKRQMALQEHLGKMAVEAARKEEEANERLERAHHRLAEELAKQVRQKEKLGEETGKEEQKEIAAIERLGDEQVKQAERGKSEARQRIEEQHNAAVAAIQNAQAQAQAIARLTGDYKAEADAAIAAYQAMDKASANYQVQLKKQAQVEKQAHEGQIEDQEAKLQGMTAEIGTFVGAIAGRKAQAEIEGAFYLAEGAFDIARAGWPPNPALLTRGLGEIGAGIKMMKVAGKGGGGGASGGGGGSSATGGVGIGDRGESRDRGGAGGGGEYDLPGSGPSSERAGTSVTLQVYGHVFADNLQTLANQLGQGIQNGSIKSFPATQSSVTKGMM